MPGARTSPRSCSAARAPRWLKRLLGRSLSDEITRRAEGIAIHIVTPRKGKTPFFHWPRPMITASALFAAIGAVAFALGLGL